MTTVTDNWLSTVDSGTYKWTFYIVNTEIYNDPTILGQNDTAALNTGSALIISESGVTGSYALENLTMLTRIVPGDSSGSTTPTDIVFEIYEPLGFSLLDRILTVGKMMDNPVNLYSQHYILKLEFLGRDRFSGATKKFPGTFLYKTHITSVKASLGPAGAKYFIVATCDIKSAQIDTVIPVDIVVKEVTSVKTFASSVEKALNDMEVNLLSDLEKRNGVSPPRFYTVKLGESTNIQTNTKDKIVAFDLTSQPWAGTADSSTSSGESVSIKNSDSRDIAINSETQITQKLSDLISKNVPSWSTYVNESTDTRFYTPHIYVSLAEELIPKIDPSTNRQQKIIHITIEVGISKIVAPSTAEGTANLQTTPSIQRDRFDNLEISKKYNYLYTGENSEVLDFQIDIQNLFTVAIAPAAGLYYADNNQQFTPTNPVKVTVDNANRTVLTFDQSKNSGAKFLGDIKLERMDLNQTITFDRFPTSSANIQKNEHTAISDDIAAALAQQSARREGDAQEITLQTKGDPFWLGTPDSVVVGSVDSGFIANYKGNDALIGFLNYQANSDDLLIDQKRGPVDMISTGIYRVTLVENKFQVGQFTQTITAFKDPNTNVYLTLEQLINIEII